MDFNFFEGRSLTVKLADADAVIIQMGSSVEESIWVRRSKDKLIIQGPMNCNTKAKTITIEGWEDGGI